MKLTKDDIIWEADYTDKKCISLDRLREIVKEVRKLVTSRHVDFHARQEIMDDFFGEVM